MRILSEICRAIFLLALMWMTTGHSMADDSVIAPTGTLRAAYIVANLAQQWAQQDLALLYQQLDKLPAGAERDVLFKQVSVAQAQADPQTAARMAAEKISAGPDQNEAVLLILRQWAKKDMAAAVAWSNQFPDEQLRGQAKVLLSGNLYGAYLPP